MPDLKSATAIARTPHAAPAVVPLVGRPLRPGDVVRATGTIAQPVLDAIAHGGRRGGPDAEALYGAVHAWFGHIERRPFDIDAQHILLMDELGLHLRGHNAAFRFDIANVDMKLTHVRIDAQSTADVVLDCHLRRHGSLASQLFTLPGLLVADPVATQKLRMVLRREPDGSYAPKNIAVALDVDGAAAGELRCEIKPLATLVSEGNAGKTRFQWR